jgi:hypothetical protein
LCLSVHAARPVRRAGVGHQPAVGSGAMAAKPVPGIKIDWFGH